MYRLSTAAADAIRQLVNDLVASNYTAVVADGRIGRLTQDELQRAITDYGRTLVPLPDASFDEMDVYPSNSTPGELSVDLSLWTEEQGRSDLTLSLTIIQRGDSVAIAIDDLHVL